MSTNELHWNQSFAEDNRCPYCGVACSEDSLFVNPYDMDANAYRAFCKECDHQWWDCYASDHRFEAYKTSTGLWTQTYADEERCPYCGSGEWGPEVFDPTKGFPSQCESCGKAWWDCYHRTGFEPYPEDEDAWERYEAARPVLSSLRGGIPSGTHVAEPLEHGSIEGAIERAIVRMAAIVRQAEDFRLHVLASSRSAEDIAAAPWHTLDSSCFCEEAAYSLVRSVPGLRLDNARSWLLSNCAARTLVHFSMRAERWATVHNVEWKREGS